MASLPAPMQPVPTEKRESTARARAALIGATLTRGENSTGRVVFVLSRWASTRELNMLDEVERLLDRMGAPG